MRMALRQLSLTAVKVCLALLLTTLLFSLFLRFDQRPEKPEQVDKGLAIVIVPLQPKEHPQSAITVPELPAAPSLPAWQKIAPPQPIRTAKPLPVHAPTLPAKQALPVPAPKGSASLPTAQIAATESPVAGETAAVFDLKDVDGKPRLLTRVVPEYPRYAFDHRIEGEVLATFTLDRAGVVRNPRILKADPPNIFEAAVLAALTQWKFAAATKDGTTVAVRMIVPLTFRLER